MEEVVPMVVFPLASVGGMVYTSCSADTNLTDDVTDWMAEYPKGKENIRLRIRKKGTVGDVVWQPEMSMIWIFRIKNTIFKNQNR